MHVYLYQRPKKSVFVTTRSGRKTGPTGESPTDTPSVSPTDAPAVPSSLVSPTDLPISSPISPRRVHFDPGVPLEHLPLAPPVSVESWGGVLEEAREGGILTPDSNSVFSDPQIGDFSDDDDDDDEIVALTHTQDPHQLVVSMQQVDELDLGTFYSQCPVLGHFELTLMTPAKSGRTRSSSSKIAFFGKKGYAYPLFCKNLTSGSTMTGWVT